jgi:hypothetical protein
MFHGLINPCVHRSVGILCSTLVTFCALNIIQLMTFDEVNTRIDKVVANHHRVKLCHRLIRCVLTNYLRYTIKLIMADAGQTGVSGEQSRRCLVLIQI